MKATMTYRPNPHARYRNTRTIDNPTQAEVDEMVEFAKRSAERAKEVRAQGYTASDYRVVVDGSCIYDSRRG